MGNGAGPAQRLFGPIVSPFGLLAVSSIACVAVIGFLLAVRLRQIDGEDAAGRAGQLAGLAGTGVVQPELTPAVLRGDPAALAHLDAVVRGAVVGRRVVRVKVWDTSGRIVYSDEPRLIGLRFALEPADRRVLSTGGVHVARTDLRDAENRFEHRFGELVATYVRIRGPGGRPMLFESYERLSALAAGGSEAWRQMLPSLLGGLLLLLAVTLALAVRFGRRVRREDRERTALMERAIVATDRERRRIAADLHDGVVQDLTAVSYTLAGAVASDRGAIAPETAKILQTSAEMTRRSVQSLRSLLVEAYPPDPAVHGLGAALEGLLTAAHARGVTGELSIAADMTPPSSAAVLLFRAAQEGVRNVVAHAQAERMAIRAGSLDERVWLEVRDDGVGFDSSDEARDGRDGHVGLRALRNVLEEAGGSLGVASAPGQGTVLRAEVPSA